MATFHAVYNQLLPSETEVKFLWFDYTGRLTNKPYYRQQRQAGISGGEMIKLGELPLIFSVEVGVESASKAVLDAMESGTGTLRILDTAGNAINVKLMEATEIQGVTATVTMDVDNVFLTTYKDYIYNVTFAREGN